MSIAMPLKLRPPASQAFNLLSRQKCRPFSLAHRLRVSMPPINSKSNPRIQEPPRLDPVSLHRAQQEHSSYYRRRSVYASIGLVVCGAAIYFTIRAIDASVPPSKMDSGHPQDPHVALGRERKVVVQKIGEEPHEIPDLVETGTNNVGPFPRIISFVDRVGTDGPGTGEGERDYQLMGLGIRTVSFLGIEVYVVGMYIATDDIARLQEALIRKIDPVASTLVAGEKEKLKELLFDPTKSEEIWNSVLKETGVKMLVRIVPARNTDFHHLRDAWVRQITAKAQSPAYKAEFADEAFGQALQQLKKMMNRGSVPKGKELLLYKDGKGKLVIWYDDGKTGAHKLGQIEDNRISRAIWLTYLGGKTVASEAARKSIVDGIMGFVERPVGTVAAQVHV